MDYTNFNMRLDNNLRGRAYPILEQYGLTPSQAVRMFFNQIAQTGKVPLSFDWADTSYEPKPTAKLLRAIKELEQDDLPTYSSIDELLGAMNEKV